MVGDSSRQRQDRLRFALPICRAKHQQAIVLARTFFNLGMKARMDGNCKFYTVDKGLAGGAPGAPATYVGMCHIFCDSVEAFQAGFGPHAKEIMADIPNYTDQSPVIQISEVVVG